MLLGHPYLTFWLDRPFAVVWLHFSWHPLAGLLSCAWRLTVWSPVHGPREPTSGYVKLLLPPRQSRGNSLVGLDGSPLMWIKVDELF